MHASSAFVKDVFDRDKSRLAGKESDRRCCAESMMMKFLACQTLHSLFTLPRIIASLPAHTRLR